MLQLGDVTRINGAEIEPVDVITFGSPCQDLSIAGKQAGLDGERSGLFFEATRIIREMREATDNEYPTYAIWENVPGALSSAKGEDFWAVLQELAVVAGETIPIPRPASRWTTAGEIVGNDYSIAWRILDAKYWGVPQRRRRIYLVADFGGHCASEILFDRSRLPRHFGAGRVPGQASATDAGGGAALAGRPLRPVDGVAGYNGWRSAAGSIEYQKWAPCMMATNPPYVVAFSAGQSSAAGSIGYHEEASPTLRAASSGTNQAPTVAYCLQGNTVDRRAAQNGAGILEGISYTLNTIDRHAVVAMAQNQQGEVREMRVAGALSTGGGIPGQGYPCVIAPPGITRRLTPLECERLQGYPDGWTDIPDYIDSKGHARKATDTARYKALGNPIALPCAEYVLQGVADCLQPGATLGSLFDGIGGFPLVWETISGAGTARWASEIEDFPAAVTACHFEED